MSRDYRWTAREVHSVLINLQWIVILKRFCCAKDLPRCFNLKMHLPGSDRKLEFMSEEPRSRASIEAFREILRATEALQDDK